MSQNQMDFLKGAVVGGLVGAVAGLLLAPKSGKKIRQDIADGFEAIQERTQEVADNIKCRSSQLLNRHEEEENGSTALLTGGALGAVVGAIAALLLAPQSGEQLREGLGDKYDEIRGRAEKFVNQLNNKKEQVADQIDDWKDTFNTILEKFANSDRRKHSHSKLEQIADWATLGMQIFQQLQKRR